MFLYMDKKIITVFTPTYNRAYILHVLYNSLREQTMKNFVWMIVDDGSTDNTKTLVENWKKQQNEFDIKYIFQENQGMHGAHNTAYEHCDTPFNVCIDSDDYMPQDAIEIISNEIDNLSSNYVGIIGLDADKTGKIIGTSIPNYLDSVKLNELYSVYGIKGDKKLVYRTDIVKKYPKYPIFKKWGENFVPLSYLYLLIDQDFDLKPINKVLCIVEYQSDGSTRNILKQYRKNPNGFAFSRINRIKYGKKFEERFKNAIHLVSSSIFAKKITWLMKTNKPFLIILAIPFGFILNIYICIKTQ